MEKFLKSLMKDKHHLVLTLLLSVFILFDIKVLIQRSGDTTGTIATQNYLPTEEQKSTHLSAMNQFPVTVEEEVISKMLPSTNQRDMTQPEFKPVLDDNHDAAASN